MCFSAAASFTAGAILSIGGVVAVRRVKEPQFYLFSAIPFFFGIQQISEGFVWLSLNSSEYANWLQPSTFIFLIFAQVVWPSYVPISIWLMESKPVRKLSLGIISLIGLGVSTYLGYGLFSNPLKATIIGHHIHYDIGKHTNHLVNSSIFYFIATVVSSFVSSIRLMPLFGSMILLSLIVTGIFFNEFVISVWCFFAAALSIIILYILKPKRT